MIYYKLIYVERQHVLKSQKMSDRMLLKMCRVNSMELVVTT